jgi:hypothetical protein
MIECAAISSGYGDFFYMENLLCRVKKYRLLGLALTSGMTIVKSRLTNNQANIRQWIGEGDETWPV